MRQAVILAPDRFALREVPRPALRGDGDVLLRTLACGICSGDLMPWYLAKKVDTVLGHEPVGVAVAVSPGVTHIRPGDLVFAHHHAPCNTCDACRRAAPVHCATWKRTKLDPGGMAEFIRVEADLVRGDCFAVNDLRPEQALFIEPAGCSVKAMSRVGRANIEGRRVVVVGCGVMGLLNVQAALAFGAAEVVAVEPHPFRRDMARTAGAIDALTPDDAKTTLRRSADVVVVGPGHPAVIAQSLEYVRDAGVACLFTPTSTGVVTPLDLGDLYFRDVSLVPSYSCGPADTMKAYELVRAGAITPERFITHRFALADVQKAFDTALAGGEAVKVIVTISEER